MRSIRIQFISFIAALLLILLFMLNTYPMTSSRDAVFEEKLSSLSSQCAVVASSLVGLDRLSKEGIADVLRFLDLSGYTRIVVVDESAVVVYDDGGPVGVATDIAEITTALTGYVAFHSEFGNAAFSSGFAMPISQQGGVIGAVYLYEHDTQRAEIILAIQRQLLLLSVVIGTSALVIASIFSFILLQRIGDLSNSMKIVAGGDYSYRHSVRGKDEIAQLGNEFNLLTERLDSDTKQRRRFVSDASHELKTPLASIRLLSDSIVQSTNMDASTIREFVTDIGNEAQRLQRTTEKLLDLSRLDSNIQVVPEPVDVKQIAVDALVLLRPLAEEKNVRLKCALEGGCVVMATGDDMFHIIFNLLENAVKYNLPGGSVFMALHADEDTVKFSVEDTGIGIPENERLNIFSRFYRVDKARSREAGGSGLGLSIAYDAVHAHGGSIAVGQNKPQGSRFIVSFPRPTSEETGI